ncbi:MAG: hypothetical protein AAGG68_03135 [Bacteroidota bacterium]
MAKTRLVEENKKNVSVRVSNSIEQAWQIEASERELTRSDIIWERIALGEKLVQLGLHSPKEFEELKTVLQKINSTAPEDKKTVEIGEEEIALIQRFERSLYKQMKDGESLKREVDSLQQMIHSADAKYREDMNRINAHNMSLDSDLQAAKKALEESYDRYEELGIEMEKMSGRHQIELIEMERSISSLSQRKEQYDKLLSSQLLRFKEVLEMEINNQFF